MSKSIINELLTKKKITNIEYISIPRGSDHQPKWGSQLIATIDGVVYQAITGWDFPTKIAAEQMAAQIMLDSIQSHLTHMIIIKPKLFLIDLENRPQFNQEPISGSVMIGVITTNHMTYSKYQHWYHNLTWDIDPQRYQQLFSISGANNDLTDHYMTLLVYPIADRFLRNHPMDVIIVSSDSAAYCTAECLKCTLKMFGLLGITVNVQRDLF